MTVKELIQQLTDLKDEHGEDTEVMFVYNYGDHWRTRVAKEISDVDTQDVQFSDYHSMHKIAEDDCDDDDRKLIIALM